jgi:hypothetical protein
VLAGETHMNTFPFIRIENKRYPSVIMGEDNFTGWFKGIVFASKEEQADKYLKTIESAYKCGVRGFSISPNKVLVRTLSEFKKSHPDIVCIANPHWQKNYYLGNESLWAQPNIMRGIATIAKKIGAVKRKQCYWYNQVKVENVFSAKEISKFRLDEDEYRKNLEEFAFCDFFLVGNIGPSILHMLGRTDIIDREIELVRKAKKIPIGMCEAAGPALKVMKTKDVAGYWAWINRDFAFPDHKSVLHIIKNLKKPLTAYKAFTSPHGFNLKRSMDFIISIPQIKSVVVGVENSSQAEKTFTALKKYF